MNEMSRLTRKRESEAMAGTSAYFEQHVDPQNEKGQNVSAMKCMHYLANKPCFNDELKVFRIPVHVPHQVANDWPRDPSYDFEKKDSISTEARIARYREF